MEEEKLPILSRHHLKESAFDEFKRFVVIFLYLWVVFALLSIHKSIILLERYLDSQEHTFAIINAFIFAKVLLIGENLHLGTRFSDKPLIHPVLHKCFVFTVVLLCFHIAESVLVGVWHGRMVADSFPPIIGGCVKGMLSVSVICFVVLLPFFAFREVSRMVGRREMWDVFSNAEGTTPGWLPWGGHKPSRDWSQDGIEKNRKD
ncbi:MAG: hypothetical protein WBX22_23145 [Silvibacterium sp.]